MKRIVLALVLTTVFFADRVQAATYGSNTAVSILALTTITGASNSILAFGAMQNGFTFSTAATLCTFSSVFPVGGPITLNSGALTLTLNMQLATNATLVNGGTIFAAGNSVILPDSISTFTIPGPTRFDNTDLVLNSDVALTGSVTFTGTSIIDGNNFTIDCINGYIVTGTSSTLTIRNVTLKNISAGKVYCIDSTGTIILNNMTWLQNNNYTFSAGTLNIANDVFFSGGPYTFAYTTTKTCTILSNAMWYFDSGMTFSYAPSAGQTLLTFADTTGQFYLYETTLYASAVGLKLTKGMVIIEGNCAFVSAGASPAQGILLGDGISSANDLLLKIMPESGVLQTSGYVVYQNVAG